MAGRWEGKNSLTEPLICSSDHLPGGWAFMLQVHMTIRSPVFWEALLRR